MKVERFKSRQFRNLVQWLMAGLLSLVALAASAAGPHALWRFDPAAQSALGPASRPGIHTIQFDPRAMTGWLPGELGELALPGGRIYHIKADRVERHESGNASWIGKFDVDGKTYVAVLTYGPAGVAGEVRMPDGHVILAMEGSQPVLIDTAEAGWRLPEVIESDAMIQPAPPDSIGLAQPGDAIELKAAPTPQTTIDVLFAYTHAMVTRAGSTAGALLRLDQLIAVANQAYIDSEVAITLRLVHALEVGYLETDENSAALNNLSNGAGVLAPVKGTLRDRYGADIVVLVRPFNYPAQASCGVAWVGGYGGNGAAISGQSYNGFAVISDGSDVNNSGYFCQNATFPHELGHNMGAMHDRQTVTQGGSVALETGAYAYGFGYVHNASWSGTQGQNVCNTGSGTSCFGTIMSYLSKASELRFSNPGLVACPTGLACGTATDNVALALNNTRAGVAAWRTTKVPFTGAQTGSGQVAAINSAFAQPLKITVRDAANQVVPGVNVNFSAPLSGASATLSASSAVTDAAGIAQVNATANGNAGSYAVVATVTSGKIANPVSFSLSNSGGQSSSLTVVVSGGGIVTGGGISCPGACTATPPSGSTVTLTPSAGTSSEFTGWLGGGCSGVGACTLSMTAAKTVSATFAPPGTLPARIDVDLNQKYDALTDGLLIVRYLFGMTGSMLTSGATAPGASRIDPAAVRTFLERIAPQLDIDGNGSADSGTDGILVVRYLFGLRGPSLVHGAIGSGATRTSASQIEGHIAGLLP